MGWELHSEEKMGHFGGGIKHFLGKTGQLEGKGGHLGKELYSEGEMRR